jgi:phosphoglycerate dehydrogenase-like enzyme
MAIDWFYQMTTRIAVLDDWQQIARDSADWRPVAERAELVFFHDTLRSEDEVVERLADFDIIVAMRERTAFPPRVVDRLPRLRFFNVTGRRASGLDDMVRRGIVVSITGGGEDGEDTAEHALALILAATRHIPEGDAAVRAGRFQQGIAPGLRLSGRTLGIVGLGLIGQRVAHYCQALGMNVIAWSRSMTPEKAAAAGVEAVSRQALFERSDVVSLHLVLSAETRNLVGSDELARMRPGSLLVNTSRAGLIDEAALLSALRTGRLQAALDVFNQEPLPADHPLLSAPNTVFTPHVGYGTREIYQQFFRNSVENIVAFLDDMPIRLYAAETNEAHT